MKIKTYLRLSLLIPFLIWVICVLIFVVWSKIQPDGPAMNDSATAVTIIVLPLIFYVYGIIGWLIPYLLLAAIAFFWSFRTRSETLLKVLA